MNEVRISKGLSSLVSRIEPGKGGGGNITHTAQRYMITLYTVRYTCRSETIICYTSVLFDTSYLKLHTQPECV